MTIEKKMSKVAAEDKMPKAEVNQGPTEEELARWKAIAYPPELAEVSPPEEINPVEEALSDTKKVVKVVGESVKVVSLETLQLFIHNKHTYSKHRVHGGGVTGVSIEGNKVIVLPPHTMVQPITVVPI